MNTLVFSYIIRRLSEASTIRALVLLVGSAFGISISDNQANYYVWIVLGIVGIVGTFLPDRFTNIKTRKTDPSIEDQLETPETENPSPPSKTPPGYIEPKKNDVEGWNDK